MSQLLAHATLEPQNFTADYKNGQCLLIGSTQFQQGAVGIKPEDITLKTTFLGGGFGRWSPVGGWRLEVDFIVQTAQISKAVGRPVKMIWSREDDTQHDFYCPMALNQLAACLGADGKPSAMMFKVTSQSVKQHAFGLPKDTLDALMIKADVAPHEIPNTRHDVVIHDTGLRAGYWRSVSHAINAFANESFIGAMAAAAGKDWYVYRLAMLEKQLLFSNIVRLIAERSGWEKSAPAGRFSGIAQLDGYDTYLAQVIEISVENNQITVHKVAVVADPGLHGQPEYRKGTNHVQCCLRHVGRAEQ